MTDIVNRLREVAEIETGLLYSRRTMLKDAADEIERLRSEHDAWRDAAIEQQQKLKRSEAERQRQAEVMEEVRKVLEPFADVADAILAEAPVDAGYFSVFMDCEGKSWRLTTDQLRAARALLSKLEAR